MGACEFFVTKRGQYKDAQEAFDEAVNDASYDHGHDGYSGTIAEKNDFQMIECPPRTNPQSFVYNLLNNGEGKFWNDKWGPAACVEVKGSYLQKSRGRIWKGKRNFHIYYFFGWANE